MVIRQVDAATGIIHTVAGDVALTTFSNGFPFGTYSGDGGPATSAGLINLPASRWIPPATCFLGLAGIKPEGIATVVDSASFETRTVTPNQILSYFGPVGCSSNEQLLVNGQTAGILFGNSTQINFVSPESDAGNRVTIQLICNGSATVTLTAPEAPASPFLFTETGTGTGRGSIVNSDGTVNFPANPIARGSYISVYGTGFGALNPAGADGLRHLAAAVTATIGGANATVLYAGRRRRKRSAYSRSTLWYQERSARGRTRRLS